MPFIKPKGDSHPQQFNGFYVTYLGYSTIRGWREERHDKTFVGGTHNAEKGLLNCAWSPDGSMVTGASADRIVHIWDELSGEELYSLPGHAGCVNAVVFHPKENVIASASSDKSIFVGELSS